MMENTIRSAVALALVTVVAGCSVAGIRDGYEQPAYQVIDRIGDDIEIRRYAPRLAVEATVPVDPENDGANPAFRLLFKYITGENEAASEIAMTSPVEMKRSEGVEIAMTAPVETRRDVSGEGSGDGQTMTMRFFLPSEISTENAPKPKNKQVFVVTLPEVTQAVLRYTGSRSTTAEQVQQKTLLDRLAETKWKAAGPAKSYFYDPPWTVPFLRRNEAAVPVVHESSQQALTSGAGILDFTPKREPRIPPAMD